MSDFKKYSSTYGNISIYPTDDTKKYYKAEYTDKHCGLKWLICYCNNSIDYKSYIVEATINPKILSGIADYITAATENCTAKVENTFNAEAKRISPILGKFETYGLHRIDYCVNFDLAELGINCTPEQMLELIKRSNTPAHFRDYKHYDSVQHRMTNVKNSLYLTSDSLNINCYYKQAQLLKQYPDNPDVENAQNVIRFEVQCKRKKVYVMSQLLKDSSQFYRNILFDMLTDEVAKDAIVNYFNRVIMPGDYYTLVEAIAKIQGLGFRSNRSKRLIDALDFVNLHRGIHKAKQLLPKDVRSRFSYTLKELSELGVNPVTIPRDWGIKSIPGLMSAYRKLHDMPEQSLDWDYSEQVEDLIDNSMIQQLRKLIG
jgi:hypothetical protein